jgi:hypothetical protein
MSTSSQPRATISPRVIGNGAVGFGLRAGPAASALPEAAWPKTGKAGNVLGTEVDIRRAPNWRVVYAIKREILQPRIVSADGGMTLRAIGCANSSLYAFTSD